MLNLALSSIKNHLNEFLVNRLDLDDEVVHVNRLINQNGESGLKNQNKVLLTLINLEQEANSQFYNRPVKDGRDVHKLNPPMYFNLNLLCVSNFDSYDESLKFLNEILSFFQTHLSIDVESSDEFNIHEKLSIEIDPQSYSDMHSLWNSMGAKYQPSLVFKVRHITIQENNVISSTSGIDNIRIEMVE